MKALKESKKLSRSQPHARGSSEGTSTKTLFLDGSTVILTLSSEETGTKLGVPNEVKDISKSKADATLDWGSEHESDNSKEANVNGEED
nr:hypothetical protein [Tanacetum cinerariifolium]